MRRDPTHNGRVTQKQTVDHAKNQYSIDINKPTDRCPQRETTLSLRVRAGRTCGMCCVDTCGASGLLGNRCANSSRYILRLSTSLRQGAAVARRPTRLGVSLAGNPPLPTPTGVHSARPDRGRSATHNYPYCSPAPSNPDWKLG